MSSTRFHQAPVHPKASDDPFRTIVDTIPTLVWMADAGGAAQFLNRRWLDYTGLSATDARGWGWAVAIHPDDRDRVTAHWRSMLASDQPGEIEGRLRRFDGEYRWFLFRGTPLRDASGTIVGWCGTNADIDERRRAEEALRLTFDNIPALVNILTATGEIEFTNQPLLDYFGRTLEELRGWAGSDVVHPDDLPIVVATWKQCVETGTPFDLEHRLRRADGNYRWFQGRVLPLLDANGRIVRWYSVLTDIDELKRAEEELRRTEGFLLEAQRLSHTGGWRHVLATGEVTVWPQGSSEMLRVYGAEPGEDTSVPEFWFNRIHPEDRQRVLETFTKCEIEKSDYRADYRIVLPDGSVKYQRSVGHPILNASGELVEFVGTAMDITEQWQAQFELEKRERDLRSIFDSIPGMVFTMNAQGEHEMISQQLLDFHGKTVEELRNWAEVIHPDDRARLIALKSRTMDVGLPYEVEHRRLRADGVYRWFNARGIPAKDSEGRVVRWYSLLTDIDDRKNAEEALRRTQSRLSRAAQIATVGELAASIAHEVNQPLAAVVANAHACLRWLLAQPPNVARARDAAERIVRDGKDAGEVVRRVRALFKRAELEKSALDVNEVVREVLHLLEGETTRRHVTVETDFAAALPPIVGDRVQLQQLILNLVLNGLEAMEQIHDRPRRLSIRSTRRSGHTALIEIRDEGIGLNDPDKAFEAFFTTKENGMGMGLAICRSIVEDHNGELWATSGHGPGTTFSFTLPLQAGVTS